MNPYKYNEGGELSNREFRQDQRFQKKSDRERKLIDKFAEGDMDRLMMALEGDEEYMKFLENRKILQGLARIGGLAALTQIFPAVAKMNRYQNTELGGRRDHTG